MRIPLQGHQDDFCQEKGRRTGVGREKEKVGVCCGAAGNGDGAAAVDGSLAGPQGNRVTV